MSQGVNQVILMGNLGADPELSQTPQGTPYLKFRMATSENWLDKHTGEKRERTDWHRITVFGARAEPLSRLLRKGSQVLVDGQIRTSTYEKNGEKRSGFDIHARDIVLPNGRRTSDEPPVSRPEVRPRGNDAEYAGMIN